VKAAIGGERDGRKLGTVLTLFDDPVRRKEFGDLFDIIPMRSATAPTADDEDAGARMMSAVRDLERFLDLVGMLASDRAAFLLDTRYTDLLSPEERTLSHALMGVVEVSRDSREASGWDQVWELLSKLGAHPEDIGRDRPSSLHGVTHKGSD